MRLGFASGQLLVFAVGRNAPVCHEFDTTTTLVHLWLLPAQQEPVSGGVCVNFILSFYLNDQT